MQRTEKPTSIPHTGITPASPTAKDPMGDNNKLSNTPFPQRPVIILGAGIIGCAAAVHLLQSGFHVVLVAEFLPGDQDILYASAWAGAAWHAAGGLSETDKYLQVRSHRHLLKMAREEPESGVCIVDAREYLESPPSKNSAIWARAVVKEFRILEPGTYPDNFASAWAYEGLVIDPTIHMPYLGKKINAMGGLFVRRRVSSLGELYAMFPESNVFINASGWGSKLLTDVQDEKCFPDRGQNVFYRTEKHGTLYFRNGQEYTYIIPRPKSGGVVLGGVKLGEDLSSGVDSDIARDEIRRAHRLAPEVVPANPPESDLSYIVGIRPNRRDGFRLESESIGHRTVLSAYGFAGGGYAFSYGVADQLLDMVQKAEFEYVVKQSSD